MQWIITIARAMGCYDLLPVFSHLDSSELIVKPAQEGLVRVSKERALGYY